MTNGGIGSRLERSIRLILGTAVVHNLALLLPPYLSAGGFLERAFPRLATTALVGRLFACADAHFLPHRKPNSQIVQSLIEIFHGHRIILCSVLYLRNYRLELASSTLQQQ